MMPRLPCGGPCRDNIMNNIRRHLLRLAGIGIVAIALPQLASASDDANGGGIKLAMGPMSASQKNQGPHAMSETTATTCAREGSCRKPHHRARHRRAAARR
jgi:hypothetical protein